MPEIVPGDSGRAVAVVGAGIVGLCAAFSLQQAGYSVVIFDAEAPGSQCSSGNAGALSAGSVAPLAMPGIMKMAIPMMFDATGPLHIAPSYWFQAAPWLFQFVRSANPRRVPEIANALARLLSDSVAQHANLARQVGCPELVRQTGQLHVYPNERALSADDAGWRLKASRGLRMEKLNRHAIHELEPAISPSYQTGLFLPDEGWLANPQRYAQSIATALQSAGTRFVTARITGMQRRPDYWSLSDGVRDWTAQHVVLAAGMGSRELLATLSIDVPLESQRGYHVHAPRPGIELARVVVLADRKVFMTPMENGLRIAGTVEFAGLTRPMNDRRALLLKQHAETGLDGLGTGDASLWMGHRPCLPDSLPVLGPVAGLPGLWCAFGHGHLGVTGSVNTGRLLAAAMGGRAQPEELAPFAVERFKR